MSGVAFIDTETTGLDPERHEVWEVGIIVDGFEHHYAIRPDLTKADPTALNIGRFYERTTVFKWEWWTPKLAAETIARRLDGRHLVGAIPWFDDRFLRAFLNANGHQGTWHYHLIDVEALAVGYLAAKGEHVELPYRSKDLSRLVGVDPDDFEAHTALGDARWAKAVYEAVMAP